MAGQLVQVTAEFRARIGTKILAQDLKLRTRNRVLRPQTDYLSRTRHLKLRFYTKRSGVRSQHVSKGSRNETSALESLVLMADQRRILELYSKPRKKFGDESGLGGVYFLLGR